LIILGSKTPSSRRIRQKDMFVNSEKEWLYDENDFIEINDLDKDIPLVIRG
jgi:hypothetical protein